MGGALRRPTKFNCGATLQQSSNIFYQKFVKIVSSGGCGEEKGLKGKRNRRSRLRIRSAPLRGASLPTKFFALEIKTKKEDTSGPPARAQNAPLKMKSVIP
jgi:hypothetical protein